MLHVCKVIPYTLGNTRLMVHSVWCGLFPLQPAPKRSIPWSTKGHGMRGAGCRQRAVGGCNNHPLPICSKGASRWNAPSPHGDNCNQTNMMWWDHIQTASEYGQSPPLLGSLLTALSHTHGSSLSSEETSHVSVHAYSLLTCHWTLKSLVLSLQPLVQINRHLGEIPSCL